MKGVFIIKKINLFMLIIFAIFTSRFFEENIFAQIEIQNIQGKEYKIIEGKWYPYFEGKKGDEIVPTRLIVRLKDKGYLENYNFKNLNLNGILIGSNRFLNGYYVLTIDSTSNPFETAKILEESNLFDVVEFDAIGKFLVLIPKDFFFVDQWNLMKINITNAWHITTGNSSIILGIIDSGVKYRHPDIDDNIWVNPEEDINGKVYRIWHELKRVPNLIRNRLFYLPNNIPLDGVTSDTLLSPAIVDINTNIIGPVDPELPNNEIILKNSIERVKLD
ncbi:MAG: hypothetical protein Q8K98_04420 [Bacteroidota bacterium]|nr:hypothetical protein [Bacteroidota bacterium]